MAGMRFPLTILVLISLVIFNSCKHEPLVPRDPGNGGGDDDTTITEPCNPNIVYFEQQILPFLVSSCAKSGCHDAASAQEGVILNSYANVVNTGEVVPFDLGDSEIWDVITETDPDKVMPPPGENPLTQAQINLIALWINQGAQNLTCDNNSGPCDSVLVSFNADVKPVLQNKCVGCHTTATSANGMVALSTHAGVTSSITGGRLIGAIKHTPGFTAMPNGGPKLNDCEIAKISNWVTEGALNN